jgi:hypothetical protein
MSPDKRFKQEIHNIKASMALEDYGLTGMYFYLPAQYPNLKASTTHNQQQLL